jgi:sugar lactone lactonase YvrE/predicted secreted protein
MNGQQLRVVVSGSGSSVTSSAVTLNVTAVIQPPTIDVQPVAQTATASGSASFSVTASGTSLAYQWQNSGNGGGSWTAITGATAATLTLPALTGADNGRQLRVVVSNSAGSVTSAAVTLTVNPAPAAPVITNQPATSLSVIAGQTATMSVVATGNPTPGYQWQLSTDAGATFTDIAGATASSYTTPATLTTDSGKRFRARVSNTLGTVTSTTVTLTVATGAAPGFSASPADQLANAPDNDFATRTATFTATVTGSPTPTYQWQLSTDGGSTFSNINGATSLAYTTPPVAMADSGRKFRLVASNVVGSAASSVATLYVNNVGIGGLTAGLAIRPNGDIVGTVYCATLNFCGAPGDFVGIRSVTAAGSVVTLAGNANGQADADGSGSAANFRIARGIALDAAGVAYVADDGNRIRKVTPGGVVTTLAGSDAAGGFVNDVGTLASFRSPRGVALDGAGNVYVADSGNNAIRKITPAGVVSTLAGGTRGTADGVGAAAQFYDVRAIAFDASTQQLFVAEAGVCTVRTVSLSGAVVTVAGAAGCASSAVDGTLSTARFTAPVNMAVDATGNVFIVDQWIVRKLTPAGTVSTLPGSSLIYAGMGIATDAAGNVFVSEYSSQVFNPVAGLAGRSFKIRKYAPDGTLSRLP